MSVRFTEITIRHDTCTILHDSISITAWAISTRDIETSKRLNALLELSWLCKEKFNYETSQLVHDILNSIALVVFLGRINNDRIYY